MLPCCVEDIDGLVNIDFDANYIFTIAKEDSGKAASDQEKVPVKFA